MAIDANSDIINTSYYTRQLFTKTLDQIRKSFFTTHKQKVVHSKLILSRCLWRLLGCWLRCIECWLWWCIGCIWGSLLYCPGCIEGRPWCCPKKGAFGGWGAVLEKVLGACCASQTLAPHLFIDCIYLFVVPPSWDLLPSPCFPAFSLQVLELWPSLSHILHLTFVLPTSSWIPSAAAFWTSSLFYKFESTKFHELIKSL